MRGTVHEPRANLGVNQKFSPVDVFKQQKGGGDKLENFNGLVKHQTTSFSSLQNGQVTKSNRTYTLRELPERFAKRSDEVAWIITSFNRTVILCFPKQIKSKSQNRERMSWTLYNFPLHCIVSYEVCIYRISRQSLHASASLKIMLTT